MDLDTATQISVTAQDIGIFNSSEFRASNIFMRVEL